MFTVHTLESAPTGARPALEATRKAIGMVPNLYGVFANDPGALAGYASISDAFRTTSLTPGEQQIVLLATSRENACEYCVAAHSTMVKGGKLLDDATLEALRDGRTLPNPKLEALREFTATVVEKRGRPTEAEVQAFLAAGYEPRHILAVLTGVAQKTLSNYTNHIAATPLDAAFLPQAWEAVGV